MTTSSDLPLSGFARTLLMAAIAGGQALLEAPRRAATHKPDGSPVTPADMASDAAILRILHQERPDLRVVSEENIGNFSTRAAKEPFILVDPLDGTKEYIAGKPDFSICIGLIVHQRPVDGIILAPLLRKLWITSQGSASSYDLDEHLFPVLESRQHLQIVEKKSAILKVITSRSHLDNRSLRLLRQLPDCQHETMGSAIKFSAIASGTADLYPRGTGSMEWDTAAGEAIIAAAGGTILGEDGMALHYGKWETGFRNAPFIAGSNVELVQKALVQWKPC
jgi:3'(2'), 5'-bisphosphate nucleotidase